MWQVILFMLLAVGLRGYARRWLAARVDGSARGPRRDRAALALIGPIGLYVAGMIVCFGARIAHGVDVETNEVVEAEVALLSPGDRIVEIDGRPTPDGDSVRELSRWAGTGFDGSSERIPNDLRLHVLRRDRTETIIVTPETANPLVPGFAPGPALPLRLRVEPRRVGWVEAMRRSAAYVTDPHGAVAWMVRLVRTRVELPVEREPLEYLPPWRPRSRWLLLSDVLGLVALVSLLPWPGLDGARLVLATRPRGAEISGDAWHRVLQSPALGLSLAVAMLLGATLITIAVWRASCHSPVQLFC